MIEKKVRELIEKEVSKMGITIDSVTYEKEGSNYFLRITIDRDQIIDIDTCVEVTRIINPLLDRKFKSPKIVFNNVFELKKDYFNYFHKVFLNSIVIGFISFILILNDLKNVCTITLILLIALLKNKLLCHFTSYLKYQIIFKITILCLYIFRCHNLR